MARPRIPYAYFKRRATDAPIDYSKVMNAEEFAKKADLDYNSVLKCLNEKYIKATKAGKHFVVPASELPRVVALVEQFKAQRVEQEGFIPSPAPSALPPKQTDSHLVPGLAYEIKQVVLDTSLGVDELRAAMRSLTMRFEFLDNAVMKVLKRDANESRARATEGRPNSNGSGEARDDHPVAE